MTEPLCHVVRPGEVQLWCDMKEGHGGPHFNSYDSVEWL